MNWRGDPHLEARLNEQFTDASMADRSSAALMLLNWMEASRVDDKAAASAYLRMLSTDSAGYSYLALRHIGTLCVLSAVELHHVSFFEDINNSITELELRNMAAGPTEWDLIDMAATRAVNCAMVRFVGRVPDIQLVLDGFSEEGVLHVFGSGVTLLIETAMNAFQMPRDLWMAHLRDALVQYLGDEVA